MIQKKYPYQVALFLLFSMLACSISDVREEFVTTKQTASAMRTKVGDAVTIGSSLFETARAMIAGHPSILGTVRAIATQGAPLISTLRVISTDDPSLILTAQAAIELNGANGEPPTDIPIPDRDQVFNFLGSSQYIFYTSPTPYAQVLKYYQTEMPANGWKYLQSDSHEYANAAQLIYTKDSRIATLELSFNPLSQTSVVVINILTH